jgi:hypothetical protein
MGFSYLVSYPPARKVAPVNGSFAEPNPQPSGILTKTPSLSMINQRRHHGLTMCGGIKQYRSSEQKMLDKFRQLWCPMLDENSINTTTSALKALSFEW